MARLPQIPAISGDIPPAIAAILQAMKDIIELRSGQRSGAEGDGFVTRSEYEAVPVWQDAVLLNSWVNFGAGYHNAGYTKDRAGVVRLRGLITSGTVAAVALRLPAGYCPINKHIFAVICSPEVIGRVDVGSNGDVTVAAGSAGYVSLDNISFLPA